jgi:hypothetical protein
MHDHEWLKEAVLIIFALGGLESILWMIDRKGVLADRRELKEQTHLLEDIAVALSVEESVEEKVESTVHN